MKTTENYSEDEKYMVLAMELAKKGYGYTAPNPVVGAVIVKNGCIIGQGYHEKYGEPHAERNALASCTQSPEGATIYVTLEPCCHHGRQPPCTDAIREFASYCWDLSAGDRDRVRKEFDHAMDEIRYFVATVVAPEEGEDLFFAGYVERHV